jgi:hypothetical protein
MEPIQTKSNTGMYVGIGVLVVLAIVIGLSMSNKNKKTIDNNPMPLENTVLPTNTNNTKEPTTPPVSNIKTNPEREGLSVGSGAGTYANLMIKYKGRMIQFNKECAVITNKQGFKQGTDILLDNRDNTPVKIVIGSRTFNLPGYGYKVIDLPTIGSFQLDCNKRLNVVTVTVQK